MSIGSKDKVEFTKYNQYMKNGAVIRILRVIVLLSIFLLLFSLWNGVPLPQKSEIRSDIVHGQPVQINTNTNDSFGRTFGVSEYLFTPHASYELRGLVVSLHHSDSWTDISHKDDPAQTVDICVVWGPNIATNGYRMVTYSHGDWTCYYRWNTEYDPPFSGNFLSNNHIIPTTPALAKLIKQIKVGDQIYLSGTLVDYSILSPEGTAMFSRHTSLNRTDTGNGACEILYLTDAKILNSDIPWRTLFFYLLIITIIGGTVLGFFLSMPKIIDSPKLDDRGPSKNPFDIKNFINKSYKKTSHTKETHEE